MENESIFKIFKMVERNKYDCKLIVKGSEKNEI